MNIIPKLESRAFKNSDICDVFEYGLKRIDFGVARVEVRGRYPDDGKVINMLCKEAAYILEGQGKISAEGSESNFSKGDLIIIEEREKFYWEGNFSALLFSVPAWNPEQYKETE